MVGGGEVGMDVLSEALPARMNRWSADRRPALCFLVCFVLLCDDRADIFGMLKLRHGVTEDSC